MSLSNTSVDYDHLEGLIGSVESAEDANRKAVNNTVLSPRFYTTDFPALTGSTSARCGPSGTP